MASQAPSPGKGWRSYFSRNSPQEAESSDDERTGVARPSKWSMGVLNDKKTIEVPGSVLLLAEDHNEPLGLRNAPARTSHSSLPTGMPAMPAPRPPVEESKKKTADGKIILEPQPDDSRNDPLNWPAWRRDSALLSLGLFCMIGGGMTPVLAAGFTNVAQDYGVSVSEVSLTTGLYMMGMGVGSVVFSPTAILWGKRPVYLFGSLLFIAASIWCAVSPNFASLIVARILQGISVSPVECLPSATIAEIFFLHERAFRIGIYTLLLLGGKNLIPLVSAAIIQRMGWRWVFWIVAMVVMFCAILLFLFVPETFWDRAPIPKSRRPTRPSLFHRFSSRYSVPRVHPPSSAAGPPANSDGQDAQIVSEQDTHHSAHAKNVHVGFATTPAPHSTEKEAKESLDESAESNKKQPVQDGEHDRKAGELNDSSPVASERPRNGRQLSFSSVPAEMKATDHPPKGNDGHKLSTPAVAEGNVDGITRDTRAAFPAADAGETDSEKQSLSSFSMGRMTYTTALRGQPALSFTQQLKPFNGRLNKDKWIKVAIRPFILFAYPAVLWSAVVYSCSVGWLIVISESVAVIYRDAESYNFNAIQTGLVYLSPFIGGILGTAVAGKVSDIVVRAMAKRNGGLYEPEFRLVMALPIAISTGVGLMGFGWSAQEHDNFMVPTVFFGIVSFGCSLGSTTAITFCVDSYRQYAGEALVTLNFSKNIFHGLVFSLFVTGWIEHDGPKAVYIWIGVIQLVLLLFTIPMFIFGKRLRMWTVRKNLMEKF